ncbi:MAG: Hsp33 family molecular chaperone HslO [Lachnospiraceae bacterium]|nr:Hsp33 family molecular chaperone HslO [Lachnospiraceae bacterium]
MAEYTDYMVQATAAPNAAGEPQVRAYAVTSGGVAERARQIHGSSPVVTAAMGRLMSAALMMGGMMKNDTDLITLEMRGDGPVQGYTVSADNAGNVRGFAMNPLALMPANKMKHLNVGGIIGNGTLTVIRDLGLKEPYSGTVDLRTGEVAEDIAWYYASSEQIPSAVGLGVLMNPENTVRCAGGFILQMMPFAEDSLLDRLEQNLAGLPAVTTLLENGYTPEQMLQLAMGGFEVKITDRKPVQFQCTCSRSKVEKVMLSLGREELDSMINEGRDQELVCEFCRTKYVFTPEEMRSLLGEKA